MRIVIHTDDRPGMLNQLTSVLSHENTNIRSLEAEDDGRNGDGAIVEMTVDVRDKKQLEKVPACAASPACATWRDSMPTNHTNDPEHIAISKSKGIKIDWKDGHHSDRSYVPARQVPLRRMHRRARHASREPTTRSSRERDPLSDVFKPALEDGPCGAGRKLRHPHQLERRALSGIYSYDHLREICPCPECASARG